MPDKNMVCQVAEVSVTTAKFSSGQLVFKIKKLVSDM
jgi:hypothetical protein